MKAVKTKGNAKSFASSHPTINILANANIDKCLVNLLYKRSSKASNLNLY